MVVLFALVIGVGIVMVHGAVIAILLSYIEELKVNSLVFV